MVAHTISSLTIFKLSFNLQVHLSRLLLLGEMSLHEVQVYLDREGVSGLVAELVMVFIAKRLH
jgi:hypothetical protein